MKLAGRVAVITGAGSGFGRQCALLFANEGAKVVIADIDPDRAAAASEWVNEHSEGNNSVAITCDVTRPEDSEAAVQLALDTYGKLDIMFANAGIVSRGGVPSVMGGEEVEFQDLTMDDWNQVCGVNLTGVIFSAKAAIPALRANGGGTILCTSSAASLVAYPNIAMYAATKAGVNGFVKGLAFDLGKYAIRVNAILPTHGMSPNFLMPPGAPVVGQSYEQLSGEWDAKASPIPLKLDRAPSLDDNAKVALWLVSDDSQYLTGCCLPSTDGGSLSRVAIWFEEDHVGAAGLAQ